MVGRVEVLKRVDGLRDVVLSLCFMFCVGGVAAVAAVLRQGDCGRGLHNAVVAGVVEWGQRGAEGCVVMRKYVCIWGGGARPTKTVW